MKLHYNSQVPSCARFNKIKAVATLLKVQLQEVSYESRDKVQAVTSFPLPLLVTQHGSFSSSNTIIRYFAAISGNQLYGSSLHDRALIDQWLDITTCDFEAAVSGVLLAKQGVQFNTTKVVEDINKFIKFVEKHLTTRQFLVGEQLSIADIALAVNVAVVLATVYGEEQRKQYPHLTAWYIRIAEHNAVIGTKDLPKDPHKAFKQKGKKEENKKDEKSEKTEQPVKVAEPAKVESEKKPEVAKTQQEEEDDLFGPAAPSAAATPAAPVPTPAPKKEKKKVVAKSIVVFDVKVFEQDQDLAALFEKIKKQVTMQGLVWNNDLQILPVVYNMKKLRMGCVIEDDKVLTDDIFEKIQAWEDEVQSVDVVSFQKL